MFAFFCLFLILRNVVRIIEGHMFIYSEMTDLEIETIHKTLMDSTTNGVMRTKM